MKSNLTIFANFFIDSEERFLRMKDSLESMKKINVDKYVVNVRGRFASQAFSFIQSNVKSLSLTSLESSLGWFNDTSKLMNRINSSYVLIWIEDHICTTPESINGIVDKMEQCDADILTYSFWQNGKFLERYLGIDQIDFELITWFDHTNALHDQTNHESFLISYPSIMKKDLFQKIVEDGGKGGRWSKMTPFNFEKTSAETNWLPLRRANPKIELFASIDDDHGVIGSSLQMRGIYPKRETRKTYTSSNRFGIQELKLKILKLICN